MSLKKLHWPLADHGEFKRMEEKMKADLVFKETLVRYKMHQFDVFTGDLCISCQKQFFRTWKPRILASSNQQQYSLVGKGKLKAIGEIPLVMCVASEYTHLLLEIILELLINYLHLLDSWTSPKYSLEKCRSFPVRANNILSKSYI